ncbi:uncharacterized protein DDB_G0284459-like [Malaya genurostris]|uniref:uncharacterized protein DDB_G0284459-like n=1 Tax=Malaya genurostris TaxID=325434 RepID=UPI0026F382CB|nr:uncharacterized protein DDB_G0284459-like [Malaya genurostris]
MSHRNSDPNASWTNRSSRSSNDSSGGGYKERNWSGSRYSSDNRYSKDRRNFRGYGGRNERRPYEDRRGGNPYRSSSWMNSGTEGNYSHSRHQPNWAPKNTKLTQQIPPLMMDFSEPLSDVKNGEAEANSDSDASTNEGRSNGEKFAKTSMHAEPNDKVPLGEDHISETSKPTNGGSVHTSDIILSTEISPTLDDKLEISSHENELIKLIEDEALKIISDAEQPLCSTSSQNMSQDSIIPATVSSEPVQNHERQATIERSAEQVTRKLINQLTTMNKYSLKQMINNPDSKYETALKTHARQKLRAEVRRQLRNFSLSESTSQAKTCGMLEPDESVDSDKIPDALLEQIGKVLDLNLLDLNVSEEPTQVAPVEDEDCVINPSDPDYSATEMLDKNLRLTDDDVQLHLDAEDIFARAELLLMKGSESGATRNSSGPSSPTDEMFPNDQIDSIVSEENGYEKLLDTTESNHEKSENLLQEAVNSAFPCFLRVNTVEELNKKVDTITTPIEDDSNCTTDVTLPSSSSPNEPQFVSNLESVDEKSLELPEHVSLELPLNEHAQNSEIMTVSNGLKHYEVESTKNSDRSVECHQSLETASEETNNDSNTGSNILSLPVEKAQIEDESMIKPIETNRPVTPVSADIPSEIVSTVEITNAEPNIQLSEPMADVIRAPTHPELSTRKSKSSRNYKPNLVQHEHNKRESKTAALARSSSTNSANSPSNNSLAPVSKPRKPGPNLAALKQPTDGAKHHNSSKNSSSASTTETSKSRSAKKREPSSSNSNNIISSSIASPSRSSNRSSPQNEVTLTASPSPLKPVAGRSRTPGPPSIAANDSSKHKKKRKRSRRKDFSPDLGMVLECDLRVSRPAVTPTPPPAQSRDTSISSGLKKNSEPEREPKTFRETRARSVDPKMICDGKRDREKEKEKDRDRTRDKTRSRDGEEKKESERENRKEKSRDDRKEKDKETKKERDVDKEKEDKKEPESSGAVCNDAAKIQPTEPVQKVVERERKKSPIPKPKASEPVQPSLVMKEMKESYKTNPEDAIDASNSNDVKTELPKEVDVKQSSKICSKEKETKDAKPRESSTDRDLMDAAKEREAKESVKQKESKEKETKVAKEKGTQEKAIEEIPPNEMVKKSPKRKKNLLRGPNLIKGRREVPEVVASNQFEPQNENKLETVPEIANHNHSTVVKDRQEISSPVTPVSVEPHKPGRDTVVSATPVPVSVIEQQPLAVRSTATILVNRTSSPRPWKSPGEKKLIPAGPLLSTTLVPMSPPRVERFAPNPIPTTPPTAASPEPVHIHQVVAPVLTQPDIITRLAIPATLCPLVTPPVNAFAPVMTLLNQMQDIDNKMSNFQRRKMQIDSEIMRLNSEKFQIDQSSMQLQNDRFMVLNALRAALIECELSTLTAIQTVPKLTSVSPSVTNRRRHLEVETEVAPKSKRRKAVEPVPSIAQEIQQSTPLMSGPESSEPEEIIAQPSAGSERTIRRITKISDNTQILKLFQRRRLGSEKSTEESHSEDNTIHPEEKAAPAKRRRTRTVTAIDTSSNTPAGGRLRSESSRLVDSKKSKEVSVPISVPVEQAIKNKETEQAVVISPITNTSNNTTTASSVRFEKDAEIPLGTHKNLLTREVKIVLSKLTVSGHHNVT